MFGLASFEKRDRWTYSGLRNAVVMRKKLGARGVMTQFHQAALIQAVHSLREGIPSLIQCCIAY